MLKTFIIKTNLWSNAKVIVASILLFPVVVFILSAILFYIDYNYDFAVQKWTNGSSSLSQFQSLYQLGAAALFTFAFAGPKLADYFKASRSILNNAKIKSAIESDYLSKASIQCTSLITSTETLVNSYEQRWEYFLVRRTRGYLTMSFFAVIMLFISSYSTGRWNNMVIFETCFIIVCLPFFQVLSLSLEASTINKLVDHINNLQFTLRHSGVCDKKIVDSITTILNKLEKSA